MNRLSNGAIAVGFEGSWMRLQAAYEFELEKAYESGLVRLNGGETIADRAERMLIAMMEGRALPGESMKAAAKACGIKPTEKAIVEYLKLAGRGVVGIFA